MRLGFSTDVSSLAHDLVTLTRSVVHVGFLFVFVFCFVFVLFYPWHVCSILNVLVSHSGTPEQLLFQRKGSGCPSGVHDPGAALHTARLPAFTTLDRNIHSAPYRHVGPPSAWSVVPGVISLIVLG